jgi:hypothetical protein
MCLAVSTGWLLLLNRPGNPRSVGGHDDTPSLPRNPIGEAAAVCGFARFFISWPDFLVTARRVAWGDGAGCRSLVGSSEVIWIGHFEWRPKKAFRAAHWEPVLDASSPPLRRD